MAALRILCVEDDPDIRQIAQLALGTIGGLTVELCPSGADAVARAVGFAPDLILLDVMMPGMDGPTTLAKLRELPPLAETPVVFMTAKVQPPEVARYRDLGAVEVIAKPFDPMSLAKQVKAIWARTQAG
jgi:CheY-like chemotaxis protein